MSSLPDPSPNAPSQPTSQKMSKDATKPRRTENTKTDDGKSVLVSEDIPRPIPSVHDPSMAQFGDLVLVQSRYKTDRKWIGLKDVEWERRDTCVWIRTRVHGVRAKGM